MKNAGYCISAALLFLLFGCRGDQGPAGPPGGDPLTDPSVVAEVIWTSPDSGSVGPYPSSGSFRPAYVRFNKLMDRNSVLNATQMRVGSSVVGPDLFVSGTYDGTTFNFYPFSEPFAYSNFLYRWHVGQAYTLQIDTSAHDLNGNGLRKSWHMSFTPEPLFRVMLTSPGNGAVNIPLYIGIMLMFNSPVDSSIGLSISSDIGSWYYDVDRYDSSRVYMYTNQNLNPETQYSISVNTSAHDKYGHMLPQPYVLSFRTGK